MAEPDSPEPRESVEEPERDERGRLTSYGARMAALRRHADARERQDAAQDAERDPQGAPGSGLVEPSGGHDSDVDRLADRELERILRSRKALNSDKIRAAEVLRKRRTDRDCEDGGSELLRYEGMLAHASPPERVALLREVLGLPVDPPQGAPTGMDAGLAAADGAVPTDRPTPPRGDGTPAGNPGDPQHPDMRAERQT